MIVNDDTKMSFQQRIVETVNYLKYCQHKTRKLNPEEQKHLLRECMLDRISRMPDDNKEILIRLKRHLEPSKNFSVHTTEHVAKLEDLGLIIPTIPDVKVVESGDTKAEEKTADLSDGSTIIDIDFGQATDSQTNQHQQALVDIVNIFYQTSPKDINDKTKDISIAPDPQKIEDIIGTLLLLENRFENSDYSLIDILPQLGDAFEAREEIIKNVLNETIESMLNLIDIDKFHDVNLKSSLDSPIKRKAFLFDLLSQSFQRTKNQHQKGVYLEQALELYHLKLKTLGIS